jgi:hypothetical protein
VSAELRAELAPTPRLQLLQLCGVTWAVAEWLPDYSCKRVLLTAERVADGLAPLHQLREAASHFTQQTWHARFRWPERYQAAGLLIDWLGWSALHPLRLTQADCDQRITRAAGLLADTTAPPGGWRQHFVTRMSDVLRPADKSFDPSWRTEVVVGLAAGMYESRDFAPMPVLADALEDAGCAAPDILAHCRGPGPHVRGCWVVDLVLGKS